MTEAERLVTSRHPVGTNAYAVRRPPASCGALGSSRYFCAPASGLIGNLGVADLRRAFLFALPFFDCLARRRRWVC